LSRETFQDARKKCVKHALNHQKQSESDDQILQNLPASGIMNLRFAGNKQNWRTKRADKS
jgi:hypothetical protein